MIKNTSGFIDPTDPNELLAYKCVLKIYSKNLKCKELFENQKEDIQLYMLDQTLRFIPKYDATKEMSFTSWLCLCANTALLKWVTKYSSKKYTDQRLLTTSLDQKIFGNDNEEKSELQDLIGYTPNFNEKLDYENLLNLCYEILENEKQGLKKVVTPLLEGHTQDELPRLLNCSRQYVDFYIQKFAKILKQRMESLDYYGNKDKPINLAKTTNKKPKTIAQTISISESAKALGITYSTYYNTIKKIKKLKLNCTPEEYYQQKRELRAKAKANKLARKNEKSTSEKASELGISYAKYTSLKHQIKRKGLAMSVEEYYKQKQEQKANKQPNKTTLKAMKETEKIIEEERKKRSNNNDKKL